MRSLRSGAVAVAFCLAAATPLHAEDVLVTQYKADPSGAPYGVAIDKGFFKKAGVDITGVVAGSGGGSSVRNAMATTLGYGDVTAAPVKTRSTNARAIRRPMRRRLPIHEATPSRKTAPSAPARIVSTTCDA